jgi:hypothetical protein
LEDLLYESSAYAAGESRFPEVETSTKQKPLGSKGMGRNKRRDFSYYILLSQMMGRKVLG